MQNSGNILSKFRCSLRRLLNPYSLRHRRCFVFLLFFLLLSQSTFAFFPYPLTFHLRLRLRLRLRNLLIRLSRSFPPGVTLAAMRFSMTITSHVPCPRSLFVSPYSSVGVSIAASLSVSFTPLVIPVQLSISKSGFRSASSSSSSIGFVMNRINYNRLVEFWLILMENWIFLVYGL